MSKSPIPNPSMFDVKGIRSDFPILLRRISVR
jgi:hypothetical protein